MYMIGVPRLKTSFEALGLTPQLCRALAQKGYDTPTPIQEAAIPVGLAGRDVVGSAQTGTGKTAAFLLPLLQMLGRARRGAPRALVLVPTRELAEQVCRSARTYGRPTNLKSIAIYGGVGIEPQRRSLKAGVDIVIATPGRLLLCSWRSGRTIAAQEWCKKRERVIFGRASVAISRSCKDNRVGAGRVKRL